MTLKRKNLISDILIEEYYWVDRPVVYIDHQISFETFEGACKRIEQEKIDENQSMS